MRRISCFCLVVLSLLVLASGAGASTGTVRSTGLEAAVAREVNAIRATRGLPPLSRSVGLARAADAHTVAMFDHGRFDHEFPGWLSFTQRFKRFYARGGNAVWGGAENIALFGPAEPTAQEIVAAWMASPGHRTNILNRGWREVGVAARFAPTPGGIFAGEPTWLITLDLGRRGA